MKKPTAIFDRTNPGWSNHSRYDLLFLQMQERYANHRLKEYEHVFLNEVFEMLLMPKIPQGDRLGWLFYGDGDGRIDFDLPPRLDSDVDRIVLSFNIDGDISKQVRW